MIKIRKMGTRRGEAHYGASCHGCPARYGRESVLAVGHLSRDGAAAVGAAHLAADHGRIQHVDMIGGAL